MIREKFPAATFLPRVFPEPFSTEENRVLPICDSLLDQFESEIHQPGKYQLQLATLSISVSDLVFNYLTELPSTIGKLTKLEILLCNNNKLARIPNALGQLKSLKDCHSITTSSHTCHLPSESSPT